MWVYLATIVDYLGVAFLFLVVVGEILSPRARKYLAGWYANLLAAALDAAGPVIGALSPAIEALVVQMSNAVKQFGPAIQADIRNDIGALAARIFTEAEAGLTAIGLSTPDNAVANGGVALADAFGFGISGAIVTAAFESVFPEKLNTLNGMGPMLAQMAGFEEVAAAIRDPLYENAFGRSAEYHYRSVFKPELPNERDAVRWHSQGLLTDGQLRTLFNYSGLKTEYEAPFVASAYRAVQPRMLATLYKDVPFPRDQVQSMMTFAGLRPQDQTVLLDAMQWASINNVRQQYVASIVQGLERGDITDAEAFDDLAQAGYTNQAINFIQLTAANRKLVQLAELYRKSIDIAYQAGLITDADYVPQLEAIGIGQADAEAHYQVAAFTKQKRVLAQEERATQANARTISRTAVAAAIANFQTGAVDTAALTAALLAAGMVPAAVPFAVAIQTAKQAGRQRLVYGKLMTPTAAKNLQLQVGAVTEQVYKKVITPDAGFAQIQAYGVDAANALQLVAKAAAEAGILWPAPFPRIPPIGTP